MLILTGGPADAARLWFDPDGGGLTAMNWGQVCKAWRFAAPAAPRPAPFEWPTDDRVRVEVGGPHDHDWLVYRLGDRVVPLAPRTTVDAWAALADGRRFVAVEREHLGDGSATTSLVVRALADGAELATRPIDYRTNLGLTAVPDAARVVGWAGGRLWVYDADTDSLDTVPGPARKLWVDAVAHPAGRVVAAVNRTSAVSYLDPFAAAVAGTFDPDIGQLTSVAASPDGLLWAAAGGRGRVAVWDAAG